MLMKTPRLLASLALSLSVSLASGVALADIRIGVAVSQFDDAYITYVRENMDKQAKAISAERKEKVTLQFQDARADVVQQLSQIEQFISQKVDAIIVIPVDTAATTRITKAVTAVDIPLVYVNRAPDDPNLPANVATVVSNEIEAGHLQGQFVADKLGGKGNVVVLLGDLANNATANRTKGVKEIFAKYPDIKITQEQTGIWLRDKGMTLTNDWLTQGQKFDAVISNNDEMAIGAAMALKQAGVKDGSVIVTGVDGTPDGLNAIKKGQMAASVYQDAKGQGGGSVKVAVEMAKKEKFEQKTLIPYQLITPENVDKF